MNRNIVNIICRHCILNFIGRHHILHGVFFSVYHACACYENSTRETMAADIGTV